MKNGKPAAVLVDAKEFAAKLASKRLARLLKQAEKEIAEGKGRDIDEFFEEFAKAHKLYRHLIIKKYRIIFCILGDTVWVARIIHGARRLDLETLLFWYE
jgi:plasmid stabilization system protein ParE